MSPSPSGRIQTGAPWISLGAAMAPAQAVQSGLRDLNQAWGQAGNAFFQGYNQGQDRRQRDDTNAFNMQMRKTEADRAAERFKMERDQFDWRRQQADIENRQRNEEFGLRKQEYGFKLDSMKRQQDQQAKQEQARQKMAEMYQSGDYNGASLEGLRSGLVSPQEITRERVDGLQREIAQANAVYGLLNQAQSDDEFNALIGQLESKGVDVSRYKGTGMAGRIQAMRELKAQEALATRALNRMKFELERQKLGVDSRKLDIEQQKLDRPQATQLASKDKDLISERDELARKSGATLSMLDQALALNDQAFDGVGSRLQAQVMQNVSPWETPQANATIEFDNIVMGQALESLKAIFGAAPTEGERKMLLEIQGSASQPREVRANILRRAKAMAQARMTAYQEESRALRTGEFFQPNYQPPSYDWRQFMPQDGRQQSPSQQPQQSQPSGPPPAAINFLRENAGNPEIVRMFEQKYGIPAQGYLAGR